MEKKLGFVKKGVLGRVRVGIATSPYRSIVVSLFQGGRCVPSSNTVTTRARGFFLCGVWDTDLLRGLGVFSCVGSGIQF